MTEYWKSRLSSQAQEEYVRIVNNIPHALVGDVSGATEKTEEKQEKGFLAWLKGLFTKFKSLFAEEGTGGNGEIHIKYIDPDELNMLVEAVLMDHAELFYVAQEFRAAMVGSPYGGGRITLQLRSVYPNEQIPTIEAALKGVAEQLRAKFGSASEEERERAVLEYILDNVTYKIDNEKNQNAAAAIYYHRAQCSGIARAVKYLLDELGVWCAFVSGEGGEVGKFESHAWNIVRIGGEYYHVDATFLLGSRGILWNEYVNVSDEVCARKHSWDRTKVPRCPKSLPSEKGGPSPWRHIPPRSETDRTKPVVPERTPPATTTAPPSEVKRIITLASIRKFLPETPAGRATVKFRYGGGENPERVRGCIPDIVEHYFKEKRVKGKLDIAFDGTVWTLNITFL